MRKLLYISVICFLFSACRTATQTIEVPVEVIKKEYIHDIKVDSVIVRDSIDRYIKGDTFYIYREHTKYQYLFKTDTVLKTDTIPQIVTITKTETKTENKIYWYQKGLMWFGGIALAFLVACLVYIFGKNNKV